MSLDLKENQQDKQQAKQKDKSGKNTGPVILFVDDDAPLHAIMEYCLDGLGIQMVSAYCAEEARKLYRQYHFAAIILEVILPDEKGFGLVEEIRESGFDQGLFLLSGHLTMERLKKAQEYNIDKVFIKPIAPALLRKGLSKALAPYLNDSSKINPKIEKSAIISNDFDSLLESIENNNALLRFSRNSEIDANVLIEEFLDKKGIFEIPEDSLLEKSKIASSTDLDKPGFFKIFFAASETLALVNIYPPSGSGKPVSINEIAERLKQMGITHGINLEKAQKSLFQADNTKIENLVVATGSLPTQGLDARIKYYFDNSGKPLIQPGSMKKADYHESGKIVNVISGDILAELSPSTPGKEGITVKGKSIPCGQVHEVALSCGENVTSSMADGITTFYAASDGHVTIKNGIINVESVLHIKGDVDFSVGNIHFKGDVIIDGSIRDNFYVEAAGSINVGKNIYAATVKAGRDIIVKKGILNQKKTRIKAFGNVEVKFCENAQIEAQGNIIIKGSSLHSKLYSNGFIIVSSKRLTGGLAIARKGVIAPEIGTRSGGATTELILGRDFKNYTETEKYLEKRLTLASMQNRLVKSLNFIKKRFKKKESLGLDDKKFIVNLMTYYTKVNRAIEEIDKIIISLKPSESEEFDDLKAFVQISKVMHSGTIIKFGNHEHRVVKEVTHNKRLTWDYKNYEVIQGDFININLN